MLEISSEIRIGCDWRYRRIRKQAADKKNCLLYASKFTAGLSIQLRGNYLEGLIHFVCRKCLVDTYFEYIFTCSSDSAVVVCFVLNQYIELHNIYLN